MLVSLGQCSVIDPPFAAGGIKTYRSYQENKLSAWRKLYLGLINSTSIGSLPCSRSAGRAKFVSCANRAIRRKLAPCRTEHIPGTELSVSRCLHSPPRARRRTIPSKSLTKDPSPIIPGVHDQASKGSSDSTSTTDHESVETCLCCSFVKEVQVGNLPPRWLVCSKCSWPLRLSHTTVGPIPSEALPPKPVMIREAKRDS